MYDRPLQHRSEWLGFEFTTRNPALFSFVAAEVAGTPQRVPLNCAMAYYTIIGYYTMSELILRC